MREIIEIQKIPTPVHNEVVIKIHDDYKVKERKSGVLLANSAHDEAEADSDGFQLSEFIIRSGVVVKMPRVLTKEYDWFPVDGEIKEGDKVYWPIVNFFNYRYLYMLSGELYIVVKYYDIHAKEVDGEPVPVNGYYLFTKEKKKEVALQYVAEKDSGWYTIKRKPENDVIYERDTFNTEDIWNEEDKCLLNVPPFQLEADTAEGFKEDYYLAQKRHILIAL